MARCRFFLSFLTIIPSTTSTHSPLPSLPPSIGETYNVLPSPTHKWYYAPHMSASEALLLKCYDSKDLNTRTPHTAFVDEQSAQDAPARESVEVRCLVRFE